MIRLRRLALENAKNTRNGSITFNDLESGASVTGLYGQNGSGKTTVITALQILKTLMEGLPLGNEGIEFISNEADHAHITAVFDMEEGQATYEATLEQSEGKDSRVANETLRIATNDARERILISHGINHAADDMGYRSWMTSPVVQWKSLRSIGSADDLLFQEETLSWSQGRSFVFSEQTRQIWKRIKDIAKQQNKPSLSRAKALADNLTPLTELAEKLARYARDNMRIVTTRNGSSVSFDYAPISSDGRRTNMLDISHPVRVRSAYRRQVERMVHQADQVMPALVPGLHIQCSTKDVTLEDGSEGVELFLHSRRNGALIPLWAESEGIRRIMGVLGLLLRMFNEPDVLVAVDELDSGIFEILLGDLLDVLATRGVGQLIFTAHNLRVLETFTPASIVFSTADPSNRFVAAKARESNNLRSMYIRAVSMGGENMVMADRVKQSDIALAFYQAGTNNTKDNIDAR